MKIDLRFATERQVELEDEIKTLSKQKQDIDQENKKLTFLNTVLEEKLEKAADMIENINTNQTNLKNESETEEM